MRTKQFSFTIALALGMLVMFMLPMVAWEGTGNTAQAQDVDVARIAGITVDITPTELVRDVGASGPTSIRIDPTAAQIVSPTTVITVFKARFELRYDPNIVRRSSTVPSAVAATLGGRIGDINDDNDGTVFFNLDFPTGTPLTVTTATVESLVDISWQCLKVGNSAIEFIDVDLDLNDGLQTPDRQVNGRIVCDRTKTAIAVLPATDRTIGINDEIRSTVTVSDIMEVYGIDFGLKFNPNVVEVVDVQPTGLLGNTRPTWEVRGDTLIFNGRSSNALNGTGSIATIVWRAVDVGSSQQVFDGINTQFLDQNGLVIKRLQTSETQPEMRMPGGLINVEPPPAELYFEDASLSVGAGSTADQDVRISGVSNFCEVLFRVSFNPAVAQVEDQDPNRPGIQVGIGGLFGSNINVTENVADNVNGTIDFRVRSQTPLNALNTPGQLAVIRWLGLSGNTNLTFVQHAIFDCDNNNIQHDIRADSDPGSITVTGSVTPTPTTDPGTGTGTPTPTPTTDPNATLSVSPTSLTFNGIVGQVDPAAQTINITTGDSWTASASVTSGGNWLTVDPTSGSGNDTVNVRTNLSGLAAGTYNGTVTVTAGSNSETVNVTLVVDGDGGGGETPTPTPTTGPTDGTISGQIRALGRTTNGQPDHSGIEIYVSDLVCGDFTVTNATPDFTTSADGRFSITADGPVRCLRAFRDGHLSGQRANPSGNLGLLELPGGDIIRDDDKIDIFDLARAGNQYQQPNPDPLVDFDSDGDVDIFDLGIIATNFGQTGPVDDWR